MYLVIDEQYRLYKTPIISGALRAECRKGDVSIVNLDTMQGLAQGDDGYDEWQDIQDWMTAMRVTA